MILDFLKRAIGAVRLAKDNVDALDAARTAYEGGAGLPGVILAYTGETSARADDLTSIAVMESLDAAHRSVASAAQTLEHGSQTAEMVARTLADAAGELREVETFFARLRGGASLRDVLEGP